jgi:hypothetical protein
MRDDMNEQERATIRESVNRAWIRLQYEWVGLGKIVRRPTADYPLPEYEQDCFLAMLTHKPRDLRTPHALTVIQGAARRNDARFFKRLGRALERPPRKANVYGEVVSRFQKFLLEHWIDQRGGLPELCRLSPDSLCEVCQNRLKSELDAQAIVKERQRMGLVTFKRNKIRAMNLDGKLSFADKDGKKLSFK